MKIALWGAGGHAGVVLDAIRQQGLYEPVAFVQDQLSAVPSETRLALPILCGRENLARLREDGVAGMVIAIGDEHKRSELSVVAVAAGFELCTIVHPSAVVCPDVRIGKGTVIFAGAVVQTGCELGNNVIVNTCVSVDHDCRVCDGAQLAPRVVLGGGTTIGEITFVGIGATVINRISIGRNCLIGAGAVVVRDIPDNTQAYGVPAHTVREREAR